jgi:DNA-binding response OmpR family regulator
MNRPLRILSSDDDESIRALLFSLLTEHGHEVEFAKSSDEVFKNLGRAKYDLLILDVNTPGMNGYKVSEKISTNIINRPKILIFTARDIKAEEF